MMTLKHITTAHLESTTDSILAAQRAAYDAYCAGTPPFAAEDVLPTFEQWLVAEYHEVLNALVLLHRKLKEYDVYATLEAQTQEQGDTDYHALLGVEWCVEEALPDGEDAP